MRKFPLIISLFSLFVWGCVDIAEKTQVKSDSAVNYTTREDTLITISAVKVVKYSGLWRRVDSLVHAYKETYNNNYPNVLDGPTIVAKLDDKSVASFSDLEYLYYVIAYPESYTQNCTLISFNYFYETNTKILFRSPKFGESDFASNRIAHIKQMWQRYKPPFDSIILAYENDTVLLPSALRLLVDVNPKYGINCILNYVKKGEIKFFATALLSSLIKLDVDLVKQYFSMSLDSFGNYNYLVYSSSNIKKLVKCAEKWLEQ